MEQVTSKPVSKVHNCFFLFCGKELVNFTFQETGGYVVTNSELHVLV